MMCLCVFFFFFFKQKTAYEMRISDWSLDVCSSDLIPGRILRPRGLSDHDGSLACRCQDQTIIPTARLCPEMGNPGTIYVRASERAPPVIDIRKADDAVEQGAEDQHLPTRH